MERTHSGSLFHAQFIPIQDYHPPPHLHPTAKWSQSHPILSLPQNDTLPPHNYENSTPFSPYLKVNKLPPHLAPTPKLWELHPF